MTWKYEMMLSCVSRTCTSKHVSNQRAVRHARLPTGYPGGSKQESQEPGNILGGKKPGKRKLSVLVGN